MNPPAPHELRLKDGTLVRWGFPDGRVELVVKILFGRYTFKLDAEDIPEAFRVLEEVQRANLNHETRKVDIHDRRPPEPR